MVRFQWFSESLEGALSDGMLKSLKSLIFEKVIILLYKNRPKNWLLIFKTPSWWAHCKHSRPLLDQRNLSYGRSKILAGSVYSKFINCYLITSLSDLQWREWTLHDLSLLLVSAMQATPTPAASFTLAFKYFDKSGGVNPMSSWMMFHEEFLCRSDYEECARALSEFNLARDKVRVCVCGRVLCVGGEGVCGGWEGRCRAPSARVHPGTRKRVSICV